ncbi:hypothetical protein [Saccharomonospora iraqiensis]|uniref:hypothetical protein n=1 Tax=Saccharomonospora iraqiensis TaxID=52698 RepID=UPI000409F719|nr:hypothetical protein [Saccharomonospora iraqiensis]
MSQREQARGELLRLLAQAYETSAEWKDAVLRDVEERLGLWGDPDALEDTHEYQECTGVVDQIRDVWSEVRQAEIWPRPADH